MCIDYCLAKQAGITYVCWEGTVDADQFFAHIHRLLADPDWPAGPLYLSDLRLASVDPSLDEKALEEAAALFGQHRHRIEHLKVAVVAGQEFPRARIFERYIMKYGVNVIVFSEISTACAWLGLKKEQADNVIEHLRAGCRLPGKTA